MSLLFSAAFRSVITGLQLLAVNQKMNVGTWSLLVFLQRRILAKADLVPVTPLLVHHKFHFLQPYSGRALTKYFHSHLQHEQAYWGICSFLISGWQNRSGFLFFPLSQVLMCFDISTVFSLSPALWHIQPLTRRLCSWVLALRNFSFWGPAVFPAAILGELWAGSWWCWLWEGRWQASLLWQSPLTLSPHQSSHRFSWVRC